MSRLLKNPASNQYEHKWLFGHESRYGSHFPAWAPDFCPPPPPPHNFWTKMVHPRLFDCLVTPFECDCHEFLVRRKKGESLNYEKPRQISITFSLSTAFKIWMMAPSSFNWSLPNRDLQDTGYIYASLRILKLYLLEYGYFDELKSNSNCSKYYIATGTI